MLITACILLYSSTPRTRPVKREPNAPNQCLPYQSFHTSQSTFHEGIPRYTTNCLQQAYGPSSYRWCTRQTYVLDELCRPAKPSSLHTTCEYNRLTEVDSKIPTAHQLLLFPFPSLLRKAANTSGTKPIPLHFVHNPIPYMSYLAASACSDEMLAGMRTRRGTMVRRERSRPCVLPER